MEENHSENVLDAGKSCESADAENNVGVTNTSKECCEVAESTQVQHEENEVLSDISLVEQLESKLGVGQIMTSVEDAYLLYCSYAHAKGFGVKKGDQRYFTQSSELQSKEFECSCEGRKDEKRSKDKIPVYQKRSARTNCKARLKIARERGGQWKVIRFDKEHNHEMLGSNHTHLLRSSRNISHAKSSTLEAMVNAGISVINAGIGVVNAVSYMENEAHGAQYLGFSRKDACNDLDRLRRHTKVENGDASSLIHYFINKSNKEPYFYWNVQVDDDDRVMNFFFRDYRCLVDYEYFGDVVSVDTSYKTNRNNLVCAPFVGINHHKQNVLFGMAVLSDETESSFEWLFNTFLDAMNRKQPELIFSNQCQTMVNAIEKVFPKAHHCLCHWHINQNAPSHLGNINGDSVFKQLWHKCMSKCDSEEEFEMTWNSMIDTCGLSGHKWLNNMYKIRHKWATIFSNDKFSAGLLATSRNESTHSALKKADCSTMTVYDFVLSFELTINSWRATESYEDARCLQGKPSSILKDNPLLSQVADIYTLNIYKMFEFELVQCLSTTFVGQPSNLGDHLFEFKVKSFAESSTIKQVVFDKRDCAIKCSCHKFETLGILCKHALKVMNLLNVNVIPEAYIKRRWMKNAKNRALDEEAYIKKRWLKHAKNRAPDLGGACSDKSDMVFVNETMRSTYDLSMRCKGSNDARYILSRNLEAARHQLDALFEKLDSDDQCSAPNALDSLVVEDDALVCRLEQSKRGKGEVHCSNAEATKRKKGKGESSQDTNHTTPIQPTTEACVQFLQFASQFDIDQQ